MAIYHMSIKIGSRGKGQSAVAAAAYRSGDKLTDKETGLTSDYTRKGGVVHSEISLCDNAPAEYADRETLWNAVHAIENKKNSRLWREFEVALPKEFSQDEQIETVRDFVKQLTDSGMCADWSLHDKGDGNPHAHIMATVRSITNEGKWAPKSRLVYDLDENGERIFQKLNKQGYKQYKSHKEDYNNWNAKERVEEWRAAVCSTVIAFVHGLLPFLIADGKEIGKWISSDWHSIFVRSFEFPQTLLPILQLALPLIFLILVGIWTAFDFDERKWVVFVDEVSCIVIGTSVGISAVFGKQISELGLNTVMFPIAAYLLYVLIRWLWEIDAFEVIGRLFTAAADKWNGLEKHEKQGYALLVVVIVAGVVVFRFWW